MGKEEETQVEPFDDNSKTKKEELGIAEDQKPKEKYPFIVFLIILNEFCERFSFYGLKTILYIYFTRFIGLGKNTATVIYHSYTTVCYFTPILGAIIADGFIGLYWTIISLSFVYLAGEIIVTLTSITPLGAPNVYGPVIGLLVIALGTGGIKPCVGAFGGNQFKPTQTRYLENFFSVFYLSINIGSTIGTLLTPIFRGDVKCFDNDCYPLAFGVPAVFMFTSIIVFIAGTKWYNRTRVKSGKNVIVQTAGCIFYSIMNKIKYRKTIKKDHWLDYGELSNYDQSLISDVKAFARVFFVFLPLPIFWALYEQQGSRWTDQAQQLNGKVGSITIKPDQFQAINPIFIVILVPVFDFLVYPLFAKVNLLKKQLQRMFIGLILACASFGIAAVLESEMQKGSLALNPPNQIKFMNLAPCNLTFLYEIEGNKAEFEVKAPILYNNEALKLSKYLNDKIKDKKKLEFETTYTCKSGLNGKTIFEITTEQAPKTIIFYLDGNQLNTMDYLYSIKDPKIGASQVKVGAFQITDKLAAELTASGLKYNLTVNSSLNENILSYETVDYRKYTLKVSTIDGEVKLQKENIEFETTSRYTILLFSNNGMMDFVLLTDIYQNGVHIGFQIIQIFVMTIAEIMFSISGVSFAYSQAPAKMKSVLQATWFLTIAFGNLIVVIVAEARFISDQVYEYVFFAGLLALATLIFIFLSFGYKYVEDDKKEEADKNGKQGKSNSVAPISDGPRLELKSEVNLDNEKL